MISFFQDYHNSEMSPVESYLEKILKIVVNKLVIISKILMSSAGPCGHSMYETKYVSPVSLQPDRLK